jgi:hypothetical protein
MGRKKIIVTDGGHRLVAPLQAGPLDVVGDVHGEISALESLLERLGYDAEGRHPAGRTLVFVGDLCDRGPDSVGVFRRVRELVAAGFAQCVAGNHELNLLRDERKHGNHWFWGEPVDHRHPEFGVCTAATPADRVEILRFIRSLPLALERDDLRVVHAAWIDGAVDELRRGPQDVAEAYPYFEERSHDTAAEQRLEERYHEALQRLGSGLTDPDRPPGPIRAIGAFDEHYQMANPVRVVTSGVERATDRPFFAAGKWRFVTRVPWWETYEGPPVLFGHYWRWWNNAVQASLSKGEPNLFAGDEIGPAMAEHHRAFCVDFSVGARFKERHGGRVNGPFHGRLAAMRWPERELVYDAEPA